MHKPSHTLTTCRNQKRAEAQINTLPDMATRYQTKSELWLRSEALTHRPWLRPWQRVRAGFARRSSAASKYRCRWGSSCARSQLMVHYRKKLQTVWHIVCIDPRVCQTTFCMSYCLPKTFCMPNCSPNMILFGNLFLFAHSFCHLLFCLPNCMRNDQIVCGIFILVDTLLDKL